jgi:uncharacterized protein
MIKDYLPTQVDPFRFAENATKLQGILPLNAMERLTPSLFTQDGEVKVSLTFGIDEQGARFLRCHIECRLTLQCQRCMQPFIHEIIEKLNYGIIDSEDKMSSLSTDYEPLLIRDGMINISDVIEEELIVNLPIVPMHNQQDCPVKLPLVVVDETEEVTIEKENPFKVIEFLSAKNKQQQ